MDQYVDPFLVQAFSFFVGHYGGRLAVQSDFKLLRNQVDLTFTVKLYNKDFQNG